VIGHHAIRSIKSDICDRDHWPLCLGAPVQPNRSWQLAEPVWRRWRKATATTCPDNWQPGCPRGWPRLPWMHTRKEVVRRMC